MSATAIKDIDISEIANRGVRSSEKTAQPTVAEIDIIQERMKKRGYLSYDEKSHRKLCSFLWYRKKRLNKKGVLLAGGTGCGKTLWLQLYCQCRMISAGDIAALAKERGIDHAMGMILPSREYDLYPDGYFDLCIDDIGAEPTVNSYGTKVEIVGMMIEEMYSRWRYKAAGFGMPMFYASTNLDSRKLSERYGERIESRISEMFNLVEISSEDRRHK